MIFENGVAGAEPPYRSSAICATASCSGFVWLTASILAWSGAVAPHSAPAQTPGVYAQMLYAMTHTSGRTKSVQDAPTTNDHDCTDAKPTKHTQPFTGERGFGMGVDNKHFFEKTYFFYKLNLFINAKGNVLCL